MDFTADNITAAGGAGQARQAGVAKGIAGKAGKEDAVKEASGQFEGMLLSIILKRAFDNGLDEDESGTGGSVMREFAAEQTALELGRNGACGISEIIRGQIEGVDNHE